MDDITRDAIEFNILRELAPRGAAGRKEIANLIYPVFKDQIEFSTLEKDYIGKALDHLIELGRIELVLIDNKRKKWKITEEGEKIGNKLIEIRKFLVKFREEKTERSQLAYYDYENHVGHLVLQISDKTAARKLNELYTHKDNEKFLEIINEVILLLNLELYDKTKRLEELAGHSVPIRPEYQKPSE